VNIIMHTCMVLAVVLLLLLLHFEWQLNACCCVVLYVQAGPASCRVLRRLLLRCTSAA
jgi:hypothetical protein